MQPPTLETTRFARIHAHTSCHALGLNLMGLTHKRYSLVAYSRRIPLEFLGNGEVHTILWGTVPLFGSHDSNHQSSPMKSFLGTQICFKSCTW